MEIKTQDAVPWVGIRRRVSPEDMGAALAEILPAVYQFTQGQGIEPASPPLTLYYAHDEEGHEFEIVGGMFLNEPVDTSGERAVTGEDLESGEVPAGDVATAMHEGPYGTLGETHEALSAWAIEQGRTPEFPAWEIYLTDPGEVAPEENKTEVGIALR